MAVIYKILTLQEWDNFQKEGVFHGNAMDLQSGFIHCSLEDQYLGIKDKYFKDQKDLVLLSIDAEILPKRAIKIEPNRRKGAKYPHIYSPLTLDSVRAWSWL